MPTAWSDAAGSGLTLTATGTCPGVIDFTLTGATADGAVVLAFGPAGSFTIPDGNCLGVALDIAVPEIAAILNADGAGEIQLSPSIPSAFCGMTLQAVDLTSCSASNSIVL